MKQMISQFFENQFNDIKINDLKPTVKQVAQFATRHNLQIITSPTNINKNSSPKNIIEYMNKHMNENSSPTSINKNSSPTNFIEYMNKNINENSSPKNINERE